MTDCQTQFCCPTSGQMLGALVSAFQLHIPSVGGPTAEFLGSGNAGKRTRDYFEGKWIPEATRHEICTWTIQSLLHSKVLPDIRLPASASGDVPDPEETLRFALFTWLQVWDAGYVVAAARWPAAHPGLSGFVIGRQVVIDLALRWAAICHLSGITDPNTITINDGRTGKGKGILNNAMKETGRVLTREELARQLRKTQSDTINDRTVDRWFDELTIPNDANLVALANVFANDKEAIAKWLRWFRLQYGAVRLVMEVRTAIGARLCNQLIDGLLKFVECSVLFNQAAIMSANGNGKMIHDFDAACYRLLVMGSGDPISQPWIDGWLHDEPGWIWDVDLRYAGNGAVDRRIAACLKVVGDWPRVKTEIAQVFEAQPGTIEEKKEFLDNRELLEFAAIRSMNDNSVPLLMGKWMADHPSHVVRVVGNDRMKAVNRAEQGNAAMNEGDFDGAIPHWARAVALENDPRRKANYLFFYGGCLWQSRSRQHDKAIEVLRESFRLWPYDDAQRDRPSVEIAIIYQSRGWFEHALQHLETDSSGFAATSGHFNWVKGRILHLLHRWSDSLECLELAIEFEVANSPDAHAFAADCAFTLNAETTSRDLAKKGRKYAKEALHLGCPWAHDKWGVGR